VFDLNTCEPAPEESIQKEAFATCEVLVLRERPQRGIEVNCGAELLHLQRMRRAVLSRADEGVQ
jgi:hypothetical protein